MTATIADVLARRVWDSRGRPTVEAEIVLSDGSAGRAIAPAGASRGSHEALELRDGGEVFGGLGVDRALAAIREVIRPALLGRRADEQASIDETLIALDATPQKSKLGGNAMIAVSMAVAHAAAASVGVPLWRYLAGGSDVQLPMPMVQLFGGGAHAGRRIDLQDFLIVPLAARSFDEATRDRRRSLSGWRRADGRARPFAWRRRRRRLVAGVRRRTKKRSNAWCRRSSGRASVPARTSALRSTLRPRNSVRRGAIALRRIRRSSTREEWVARLAEWCRRYPIVSVEDPVAEDDDAGMQMFTRAVGETVQVIGDDYLVTSAERVRAAAAQGACNAALIKPNQAGTLTETKAAFDAARAAGWKTIVSARSGESEDVTIVHLAVGWQADQLKVGSFARSERMAKWNEAIRIEETSAAPFAGRAAIGGRASRVNLSRPRRPFGRTN